MGSVIERLIVKNRVLFKAALFEVIAKRREQLLHELEEVEKKIKEFEEKYGVKFEDFEENLPDNFEAHEVWMDWKSLVETRKAIEKELNEIDEVRRELTEEI